MTSSAPARRPAAPEPAALPVPGEQLHRLMVDSLPNAAVMLFDPDLRFVLAGGRALDSAGFDADSMLGKHLRDVLPADRLALLEPRYRAALAGEDVDFSHTDDTGQHHYEVRMRPVRDDSGQVVAGLVITQEVTEQRRTSAALEQSLRRWERFFAHAPVGMWISEPGADGKVLEVNDALCALFEMSREQLLAADKEQLLQSAVPTPRLDGSMLPVGTERVFALQHRLPDGRVRVLDVSVRVVQEPEGPRALAHFVDVTDRVRAAQELRSALAFQEAVLSVIPDPVHVADAALGTHVWTSKELGRDLGWSAEALEVLDTQGQALVHPDDRALLADSVRRVAAAADGEVVQVRHRALAADGTVHWIDRRKTPFKRARDGTVEQYVSITRDVTAEVAAEEELRSASAFQEAVLTTSPDIVSVYDLVDEHTVWVSRSLGDLLGYDLAAMQRLQDEGMGRVLHPDELGDFWEYNERCKGLADGQVLQARTRVLHADGSWHVLSRRSTPFRRDEQGQARQVLNIARDITEAVAAERELEDVRAFQQAVIATTPDLILLMDAGSGVPVWSSRGLEGLLGWSASDLLPFGASPFYAFVHPDDLGEFQQLEQQVRDAADGQVVHARYRARHRDGSYRWLSRRNTPFSRDDQGAVTQYLTIVRDVTEVVEAEHNLEHAALHDPLTGLPNRRLVADRLRLAIAGTARRGGGVAVLFLDLDGFKRVNDAHGHLAGDAVLVATADRLRVAVRPEDTLGRMGGDEFVAVVSAGEGEDLTDVAEQVGARLREAVSAPVEHLGLLHRVTASIGIAYATSEDDAETVLRDADTAMYRAKTGGKDRLAVFDPEQRAAALDQDAVERALRDALARGGIEVHYQPLVRVGTGALHGVEALLRVRGEGSYLDTERAVVVAEQTGLITDIGEVVLRLACAQAVDWDDGLVVSVNLSARQIAFPQLYQRVKEVLDASGLPPERLVLELTETVLLEAARSTVQDLERLRADGVGIAIDDFGTGYASLRYLATLPVTCVKVDRSFTAGLGVDPVSRTLVHATLGLARDLGLDCVVEGIETAEQLASIGTEPHVLAQGFLLGRPGPPGASAHDLLA